MNPLVYPCVLYCLLNAADNKIGIAWRGMRIWSIGLLVSRLTRCDYEFDINSSLACLASAETIDWSWMFDM